MKGLNEPTTWDLHANSNECCDCNTEEIGMPSRYWNHPTYEGCRHLCNCLHKKTFKKATGTALRYTQCKNHKRTEAEDILFLHQ